MAEMPPLLGYAVATKKLTDEQIAKVKAAHEKLLSAGLKKTMNEAAIICGVLTKEQHAVLAAEAEGAWSVMIAKPNVSPVDKEQDEYAANAERKQGRREIAEKALRKQAELAAAGLGVPLWEILEIADERASQQIVLEVPAAPERSKFDKPAETPKYLQDREERQAQQAAAPKPAPKRSASKPPTARAVAREEPPPSGNIQMLKIFIAIVLVVCLVLVAVIVVRLAG